MSALYNEIDDFAADWLENLISAGQIAPGIVDRRSIEDLEPDFVRQFTQVHFFAGVGVWSLGLRAAGWPDDKPVWTGSCPCQPFSAAGQGDGFDDERHLWPHMHHLVEVCRPDVVLGEQVASKLGLAWFDLVSSDLEASGYAAGAVDTCAAGFGAPHIRQRLYWCAVADAEHDGQRQHRERLGSPARTSEGEPWERQRLRPDLTDGFAACGVALPHDPERRADLPGRHEPDGPDAGRAQGAGHAGSGGGLCGLADADGQAGGRRGVFGPREGTSSGQGAACERPSGLCEADGRRPGPTNGGWADADWLFCRDEKWRPVEPGSFPLAHALPRGMGTMGAGLRGLVDMAGVDGSSLKRAKAFRTGTLRGFGNGLNVAQVEAFCRVVLEAVA